MNEINIVITSKKPSNDRIKKEIEELELLISQTNDVDKLIWLRSCLFRIKSIYLECLKVKAQTEYEIYSKEIEKIKARKEK